MYSILYLGQAFPSVEHRIWSTRPPRERQSISRIPPAPAQVRRGTREMKRRATGEERQGETGGENGLSPPASAYPVSTRASTRTRLLFPADPLMPRDERTVATAGLRTGNERRKEKKKLKERRGGGRDALRDAESLNRSRDKRRINVILSLSKSSSTRRDQQVARGKKEVSPEAPRPAGDTRLRAKRERERKRRGGRPVAEAVI